MSSTQLMRSESDRVIAGVAGGIAEQRYASGEIDADELARIRSELERASYFPRINPGK